MNRAERAHDLLMKNIGRRVTIRMMEEAGVVGYTARNAVAEAKKMIDPNAYKIVHEYHDEGQGVWDNGWRLVPLNAVPVQVDGNGQEAWQF